MRILIVKTSSLGDVIHTLPALTDAGKNIPHLQFDWVVEENIAEIPSWHPLVQRIIPIALRRWRKNWCSAQHQSEYKIFLRQLRAERYDLIIDAQGLLKSAMICKLARGKRCGPSFRSARDPLAAFIYQHRYFVGRTHQVHAVRRLRNLFAQALDYQFLHDVPDYGIARQRLLLTTPPENYFVFLHGTTWETKHWPENYWKTLAKYATQAGWKIKLPWGSEKELARAQRIAENLSNAEVLPKLNLLDIAKVLAGAKAVVAVDTGLGHLAAALSVPTISLYGPTDPKLTGALGAGQIHLSAIFPCAPCLQQTCTYRKFSAEKPACFTDILPERVWAELKKL